MATFDDGFLLAGSSVWLDPRQRVEMGAATDGIGEARPGRIVATSGTVRFLRRNRRRATFLPAPFHRPFTIGDLDIELVPAGVMPGSAQVVLRRRGVSVLYFRRILPERIGPAEPLEVPRADVVLVDAPGGPPPQACSRRADTLAALTSWVERALGRSEIPIVLAEPVVAAPAVVAALGALGCEMRLHRSIYDVIRIHASLGFEPARAWELVGPPRLGQVVVLPGTPTPRAALERIAGGRVALVHDGSGPAPADALIDESFVVAFCGGVAELVAHIQRSGATEVHLSPGTPRLVGSVLRDLGVPTVIRSGPPEQVSLAT